MNIRKGSFYRAEAAMEVGDERLEFSLGPCRTVLVKNVVLEVWKDDKSWRMWVYGCLLEVTRENGRPKTEKRQYRSSGGPALPAELRQLYYMLTTTDLTTRG